MSLSQSFNELHETYDLIDQLALKLNNSKKSKQKNEITEFLNKITFTNSPRQNENVATTLIDLVAQKFNNLKKLQQKNQVTLYLNKLTEEKMSSEDTNELYDANYYSVKLDNSEEQANRISDLLAIIFNNYRLIIKKNEIINNLKKQINVHS